MLMPFRFDASLALLIFELSPLIDAIFTPDAADAAAAMPPLLLPMLMPQLPLR